VPRLLIPRPWIKVYIKRERESEKEKESKRESSAAHLQGKKY
jgi:hypothetical protein